MTAAESDDASNSSGDESVGTAMSESAAAAEGQQSIRIFARIRPRRFPSKRDRLVLDGPLPSDEGGPQLHFAVPKDEQHGLINNQKERYDFRFDRCFDPSTKQEEVFDYVAKEVVLSVMEGYNGTIFAYGQTGSGKTFTITGGAERYSDRGLIPRSIQFIFAEIAKRQGYVYTVHISYLELYNETGYDLLDNSREAKKLEDLPKVTIREDEEGMVRLQNLSSVPAPSEEEALNLLFVGDTNKMIAETPSNPASSRSHCLFIVTVTGRKEGGDLIRTGKLHLVDLAGSERVSKTGIDGTLLREAKHINLSLHYLEQVIIALHEKALGKRAHIPYRNSMMTTILRDSLGGNCKTTMIATLATEDSLIDRVALIKNDYSVNEQADPYLVIAKLKRQIAQLKAELALARGESAENMDEALPEYELERLRQTVDDFLADTDKDATLTFNDYRKVTACFAFLKTSVLSARRTQGAASPAAKPAPVVQAAASSDGDRIELTRLKQLVEQRDHEINVLIPMMNDLKRKCEAYAQRYGDLALPKAKATETRTVPSPSPSKSFAPASSIGGDSAVSVSSAKTASMPDIHTRATQPPALMHASPSVPALSRPQPLSADKAVAFEKFKETYAPMAMIEEQKALLKARYGEAKALGESANQLRSDIKQMKDSMGTQRDEFDRKRLENPTLSLTFPEEEAAREKLAATITEYKTQYQRLKDLKIEIEHMQHLLENARVKMQKDFDVWFAAAGSAASDTERPPPSMQRAWGTPPPPSLQSTVPTQPPQPLRQQQQGAAPQHRTVPSRPSSASASRLPPSSSSRPASRAGSLTTLTQASSKSSFGSDVLRSAAGTPAESMHRTKSLGNSVNVDDELAAFYRARDNIRAKPS
ncbi:hypothetical protein RI367_005036 [Sorochytrium milnesiophthora]